MLNRPGFRTSEWAVALVTAVLNILNSSQNWVKWQDAILPTAAAAAYVISRGLAKTEPRPMAAAAAYAITEPRNTSNAPAPPQ